MKSNDSLPTVLPGSINANWVTHLHQLGRHVDLYLAVGMARRGHGLLKSSHVSLLYQVQDGMTSADLVHRLGITKQGVSHLVRQLKQGDYLLVQPAQTDNRASQLFLSRRGRDGLVVASELLNQLQKRYTGQLGQLAYDDFFRQLAKLSAYTENH